MKIYTMDELRYLMNTMTSVRVFDPEGNVVGEVRLISSRSDQRWRLDFYDAERSSLCEFSSSTEEAIIMMMSHFGSDKLRATMDRHRYLRFFPRGSSLEWEPRALDKWRTTGSQPVQLKPRMRLVAPETISSIDPSLLRRAN